MKFITFILCLLVSFSVSAAGFAPIANIVKIKGEAFINKDKVETGAEVAKGMEIKIPKKTDYIVVKFQNGHLVRFSGATVKIEELTENFSLMNLIKGEAHSLIKTLTEDEKFMIKTKYASFAVRGTKFGVSVDEKKKQAYLCVCDGVVSATNTKGNLSVDVKKDEDVWIGLDSKELIAKKSTAEMRNMTNQKLDEIKDL